MLKNVWRHEKNAKCMYWSITANEEDTVVRMKKTIEFQRVHNAYLVYEKSTGEAIGFAGIEKVDDRAFALGQNL